MKCTAYMFLALSILFSVCGLQAQVKPLDTVETSLRKLIGQMDALYTTYQNKYKPEGVFMHAITLYEYGPDHKMICEKSRTADFSYNKRIYNQFDVTEDLRISSTEKHLVLRSYDSHGRPETEDEYTRDSEEHNKYTYEQSEKGKDTSVSRMFINGRLEYKFITVSHDDGRRTETLTYHYSETSLSSRADYTYDSDKKLLLKRYYKAYDYPYENETVYRYTGFGEPEKQTETNRLDSTVKDTRYFYDSNQHCIREEEYEKGKLSFTRYNEFDTRGNLTDQKGFWGSGNKSYECIYEYDADNNKIIYLYFYFTK